MKSLNTLKHTGCLKHNMISLIGLSLCKEFGLLTLKGNL